MVYKGYIYATDSFVAIKAKTDLPDTLNEDNHMKVINTVWPIFSARPQKKYKVSCKNLDIIIDAFKKEPILSRSDMQDCPKCRGQWSYDCPHCHQDMDCEKCEWEWLIGVPKPTWEFKFIDDVRVLIDNNTVINGSYLILVREVARELGKNFVEFQFQSETTGIDNYNIQPLYCKVDTVKMILMPLKVSKADFGKSDGRMHFPSLYCTSI